MRCGMSCAVLAIGALVGCSQPASMRDMVGYVPPTSLPAQPKRTMVQDQPAVVWNELLTFLERSAFEIDHVDPEKQLIIARYSGNPEPFVDCGSIVTHEDGALGEIPGSVQDISLNHQLDQRPVTLKRALDLDSRIIIRLQEQRLGTVVSTDTTYVVTKTVDVEAAADSEIAGSSETVSFSAGRRAEFSKGTACQPNGFLDVAILRNLSNVLGSNEITRAELPVDDSGTVTISNPVEENRSQPDDLDAWIDSEPPESDELDDGYVDAAILPSSSDLASPVEEASLVLTDAPSSAEEDVTPSALPVETAALVAFEPAPAIDAGRPEHETLGYADQIDDAGAIIDDTTRTLLASLDCQGREWHFCEMIDLSKPYRKRNIEQAAGLTVDTVDGWSSQRIGDDLELHLVLPDFPSYLNVIYLDRNGMINQVSASPARWPAELTHRFKETGLSIPGPAGLAMIVAFVSEKPLLTAEDVGPRDAEAYLRDLRQRLADIEFDSAEKHVMASHLLINVE